MIGTTLEHLRSHLNEQLLLDLGGLPDDPSDPRVVFLDGDKLEPLTFKLGAVSMLLLHVEEERVMRQADPYRRGGEDGKTQRVPPDIRLILHILFVARFKRYDQSWQHLSKIIEHFQVHPVLEPTGTPGLPVERLVFELVTQTAAEQNEVWSALRATLQPSVSYRVKLLALRDQKPVTLDQVSSAEIHWTINGRQLPENQNTKVEPP